MGRSTAQHTARAQHILRDVEWGAPNGRGACMEGKLGAALVVPCLAGCQLPARWQPRHAAPSLPCSASLPFQRRQNGDINEVMAKADKMAAEIAGK